MSALGYTATALLDGLDGQRQTISAMQELIDQGSKDWQVRERAEQIARSVPSHEDARIIGAVYDFFVGLQGFPYRRDPLLREMLQGLPRLPMGGDCDCYAIQAGAVLQALGYEVVLAVADDEHVFLRVLDPENGWIPFDPVMHFPARGLHGRAGLEPPHQVERTYPMFAVTADSLALGLMATAQARRGLGDFDFGQFVRNVGYALDPTRKDSVTRGLIQAIPGVGGAVVAGADVVAAAKRAAGPSAEAAPAPAPDPTGADTIAALGKQLEAEKLKRIDLPADDHKVTSSSSAQKASTDSKDEKDDDSKKSEGGVSAGAVVGLGLATVAVLAGVGVAIARAGKLKRSRRR